MDGEGKFNPYEYKPGGGYIHPERKIVEDSINVWTVIGTLAANPEDMETLVDITAEDLPTYEDYIRRHYLSSEEAEILIKESDPAKIEAFNELVAEFNSQRVQIAKDKNFKAIQNLWTRANALIRDPAEIK